MNDPAVSVVIPSYNSLSTIREALESVVAQTFSDYEIIVVDDASTDGTADRVRDWSDSTGVPVQLVHLPENRGPAAARNEGCRLARGEWIAFLDADDLCVPDRVDVQLRCARENPTAALVCGHAQRIVDDSDERPVECAGKTASSRALTLSDFIENNEVATSTVMVKRDVMLDVGGFDTQFRGPEDLDLWLRIAAAHEVRMLEVPLARYRYVPASLSMDPDRFLPQVLGVLDKAFAPGGALADHASWRRAAVSTQVWNAAWMAFVQGRRARAVAHWLRAYGLNIVSSRRAPRKWFRILLRYLVGPRP